MSPSSLPVRDTASPSIDSRRGWARRREKAQAYERRAQIMGAPQAILQATVNFKVAVECQVIIAERRQGLLAEETRLLQDARALCERVRLAEARGARAEITDLQEFSHIQTTLGQVRAAQTANCTLSVVATDQAGREFGKFGHLIWDPMPDNARHSSYPVSVKAPALPGQPEFSEVLARGQRALENRELALNSGWGKPQVALDDLQIALAERNRWKDGLLGQLADDDSTSDRGIVQEQLAEVLHQVATVQGFISRFEPAASEAPARI